MTATVGVTEGASYPVYNVALDGTPIVDVRSVDGSSIHSVEIYGAPSIGVLGALLGDRYDGVFGEDTEPACTPGLEEQSGRALCPGPFSDHITLVFAGSWDGPDGVLPPRGNSCPPVQITDQRRHETGPIVGAAALAQRSALNWCPEPV